MTTPEHDRPQNPGPTPNPFAPPSPPRAAPPGPWGGASGPATEPVPPVEPAAARTTRNPHPGYGVTPARDARPAPPPPPAWPAHPAGPAWSGATQVRAGTDERDPWVPSSPWPTTDHGAPGGPGDPGGRDGDDVHRPTRSRRALGVGWLVPLLLLSLLAGGVGGVLADRTLGGDRLADAGLPVRAPSDGEARPAGSVAGIAASVLPSVVSIEVTSAQGRATGSGFVLRQDGYLMTNNHVIAGGADPGADIRVLFSDGSEEIATIVGRTSDYDLAVLKVDRTGLDPLLLAESSEVMVGDAVIAIGAPLGLEGTVTTGIVSALNRPVQAGASDQTAFINAIQTDAAINPGNSGGPLVNGAGEVIGINSAIAQPPGGQGTSGGSIGLGFAIPSDQARRTAEELIETGSATYPIIGVLLDESYTGEGVQVAEQPSGTQAPVTPGGPADDAGIRPGDVIVAIDGRPVTEPDELIVAIRAKAPGDTTVLRVRTGEEEREVRVVLDQATSD